MVARHQYLRHRAPLPELRPRILGMLEEALGKTLLGERLGAAFLEFLAAAGRLVLDPPPGLLDESEA